MSKKTYRVIANYFARKDETGQLGHCILGIYLAEKHGFRLSTLPYGDEYFSPDGRGPWTVFGEYPDDVKKMGEVFGKYKAGFGGDVYSPAAANNMGAPLAIIQEALGAVGIDVDLIEGRTDFREWESHPNIETQLAV